MPYPIKERLKMRIGYFSQDTGEKYRLQREKLEQLPTLKEKLEYFNKEVSSLSLWPMNKVVFMDWSKDLNHTNVYCGRRNCKCGIYSPGNEKLYWSLRGKEVKRLMREIKKRETYAEQLRYLLTQPGFLLHPNGLIVYPNIPHSPDEDGNEAMRDTPGVINLTPGTTEQISIYNEMVQRQFLERYKPNGQYSYRYKGFDFEKEKTELNSALQKALEPQVVIKQVIADIEAVTRYKAQDSAPQPETTNYVDQNLSAVLSHQTSNLHRWKETFIAMVEGHYNGLDYSRQMLHEQDFEMEEHAAQVVLFYKYLLNSRSKESGNLLPLTEVPFIGHLFSKNLNIPRLIIDHYHALVQQPSNQDDISPNYVGPLNWYNAPFRVCVHGAYPLMTDWDHLMAQRASKLSQTGRASENEFNTALQAYAAAFVYGYHSFEKEEVERGIFQDTAQRAQIVFDYATGGFFLGSGFPETVGPGKCLFDGWTAAGKEAGKFYRAWYLIIENYKTFLPLFEERIEPKKERQESKPEETQAQKLTTSLEGYGFNTLPRILCLSKDQVEKLTQKIAASSLPYQIAMLHWLGFIDHLKTNHFQTKSLLDSKVANLLNTNARNVKGNRLVLQPKTSEDKSRYTAHLHINDVEKDYQSIK